MIRSAPLLIVLLTGCATHEPVGVVLSYATADDAAGVDLRQVLRVVERRVRPWASAKLLNDGRIEVGVYGGDRANVERVRSQLAVMGKLEFQIVADDRFNGELIAIASDPNVTPKDKAFTKTDDGKRKLAAQWCAVSNEELRYLRDGHAAIRENESGNPQILVLIDDWKVTGADLMSAVRGDDARGNPCIHFALSSDGARRMSELTGAHLPDPADSSLRRRLAIVFDGEVRSAPLLTSRIEDRGEVNGNFSEDEVELLCATLHAGALPARLKLVSESVAAPR